MKFLLPVALGLAALLAGCSGDHDKPTAATKPNPTPVVTTAPTSPAARQRLGHRIDSLEKKVQEAMRQPDRTPDIRLTMYLIQAYQYLAHDFPQDPRGAEGLDRAGQLYGGVLNDQRKAVEYYERAYLQYPQYKNRPQLLLQEGVAYEALQDTAGAASAYRRLLVGYPQHPLAEQAKGLLKLLRMSKAEQEQFFGKRPPKEAAARK